ncbi:hypothetical protein SAMN05216339_1121, partial [Nitrosomonas eutropha]
GAAREKLGRNACSTFLIVDAQSAEREEHGHGGPEGL